MEESRAKKIQNSQGDESGDDCIDLADGEIVKSLSAICCRLNRVDVEALSHSQLKQLVIDLDYARRIIDAARVRVVGELDHRGVTDSQDGLSTAGWLSRETHIARSRAKSLVRTARAMRTGMDKTMRALSDGTIGLNHATTLARVTTERNRDQIIDIEDKLLGLTRLCTTYDSWARTVTAIASQLDEDGSFDPHQFLSRNQLTMGTTKLAMDGEPTLHLNARFVGEYALQVRQVLDREADHLFSVYLNDHQLNPELKVPTRSTLRALAMVELLRHNRSKRSSDRVGSVAAADVSLIVSASEFAMHHKQNKTLQFAEDSQTLGSQTFHRPRSETQQYQDLQTDQSHCRETEQTQSPQVERSQVHGFGLLKGPQTGIEGHYLGYEHPYKLRDGTMRMLLCDPVIQPIVVNSLGVPLDMGRNVRFATNKQRRALAIRDGGCVFPGCIAPPEWCDAHHVDEFQNGGPTNLNNLVSICRHHHGVTHRDGWTMCAVPETHLDDRGKPHNETNSLYMWKTPEGLIIYSQRHQLHQRDEQKHQWGGQGGQLQQRE